MKQEVKCRTSENAHTTTIFKYDDINKQTVSEERTTKLRKIEHIGTST
jgi:hypothetical protein